MFMVVFTSAEGKASQHPAETLDEAVAFVERLRNTEGVTDTRLYKMTEVPLEVKAYYKVEIGSSEVGASAPAGANGVEPVEELNPTS